MSWEAIQRTLIAVASWRGPDGRGKALWMWAALLLLLGGYALALTAHAPVLSLLWVGLALSVLIPALMWLGGYLWRIEWLRLGVRSSEPLTVAVALGTWTWVQWAGVYTGGRIADTKDHHVMLERAREIVEALQSGTLQFYSHTLQGGDAVWDLYPVLPAIFVWVLDTLPYPDTSFEQSYTLMVVLSWWLRGMAVYCLARRFGGVVPAALITVASLHDVGGDVWDGTWSAAIHWGMVHSNVGLSFAALAVAFQTDLLKRTSVRTLWLGAIATALSLLAHPLGLLYLGLGSAATTCVGLLCGVRPRRLLWVGGTFGLGVLLVAWWLFPYLHGLAAFGMRFPWVGETYVTLGKGLLSGTRPTGEFGAFHGLALIAVCASLASKNVALRGQALVSLLLWCTVLTPFTIGAQFFELLPGMLGMQPTRLFMVLKLSVVPALSWALTGLTQGLWRAGSMRVGPALLRAFALTLLLFGVGHSLDSAFASFAAKLGQQTQAGALSSTPGRDSEVDAHLQRVMDWIGKQREHDPSKTPWRMAVRWRGYDLWGLWRFPWRIGVPLVQLDPLPGNFLAIKPQHYTYRCLSAWNVRYVITRETDKAPFPRSRLRLTLGRYRVWELEPFHPAFVKAPQGVQIRNLSFSRDEVKFQVEGAEQPVLLQLRMAWYPRWRATHDGTPTSVTSRPAHEGAGEHERQLAVEAANGEVVLRAEGGMPRGALGQGLSWFGLCLGVALSFRGGRRRGWRYLTASTQSVGQWLRAGLHLAAPLLAPRVVLPVAGLILLCVAWWARSNGTPRARLPGPLGGTAAFTVIASDGRQLPCTDSLYGGSYRCQGKGLRVFVTSRVGRAIGFAGEFSQLWPGVHATLPTANSALEARFSGLRSSRQLKIRYDCPPGTRLDATVDGHSLGSMDLNAWFDTVTLKVPEEQANRLLHKELVLRFTAPKANSPITFGAEFVR